MYMSDCQISCYSYPEVEVNLFKKINNILKAL